MKTYIRIKTLILFTFCASMAFAQELIIKNDVTQTDTLNLTRSGIASMSSGTYTPEIPDIIPPSPVSQAFAQFRGFDPDYSTGAVNVSIPLHTITYDDFELPLTLNYQSNGIKIGDPYMPLGYGWMLHPGLRITRTVMGRADDYSDTRYMVSEIKSAPTHRKVFNLHSGTTPSDYQYDIYTICLPSGNAKFILEPKRLGNGRNDYDVISIDNPYKIEVCHQNLIHGFKITDDKGIEYYFGEESHQYTTPSKYIEFSQIETNIRSTGFYLRKVILPGHKEINFNWKSVTNNAWVEHESMHITVDYPYASCGDINCPFSYPTDRTEGYITEVGTYASNTLSSISGPDFHVDYAYTGNWLTAVCVYDGNWQIVKSIRFSTIDNLLTQLTINGVEKYQFRYNEQRFENRKSKDFWGYYNGKNNTVSFPAVTITKYDGNNNRRPYLVEGADKYPNELAMKANILEEVIYPTGGSVSFEYEAHRYNRSSMPYLRKMEMGGGLRVKRMITKADDLPHTLPIVKEFKYGQNESGYGICTVEPNENTFVNEMFNFYLRKRGAGEFSYLCYHSYRELYITHNSKVSNYFLFNLPIWYDVVTEYTAKEHKTEYNFTYNPDVMVIVGRDPVFLGHSFDRNYPTYGAAPLDNVFENGPLMEKKKVYKRENGLFTLVLTENNYYAPIYLDFEERFHMYITQTAQDISYLLPLEYSTIYQYEYLISHLWVKTSKLINKTTTQDGVKQTIRYTYDNFRIKSVTTENSRGDTFKEEFLYADNDLSDLTYNQRSGMQKLVRGNRLYTPVSQSKYINGNTLAGQKTTTFTSIPILGSDHTHIVPEVEYFKTSSGEESVRVNYEYNSQGKPAYVVIDQTNQTVYLWGYSNQHPVAEIKNVTYDQVKDALGRNLINRVSDAIVPSDSDLQLINNLRVTLPEAHITTYTYKPLVGITSVTDPRNFTTYYMYDTAGRLKEIYMLNNGAKEVIESYSYQYANQ